MKYGTWNIAGAPPQAVARLTKEGHGPLTAMVLAARGLDTEEKARQYLSCDCPLPDPLSMRDMDKAARRIAAALERGESMAVFGDYDVDGITATCLLVDYLRSRGGNCLCYIPGRLEEGYGLNPLALEQLAAQGVTLIITVDCGITAIQEAELCRELGMDLVITDHHECKEQIPSAVAVVDPHRKDCGYPHRNLSGVGVAFKLAAVLEGSQQRILQRYSDMVCLGTVADVMCLRGENRVFVSHGLASLRHTDRPGLKALMEEAGCDPESLTAGTIGYVLAPRINAAGRMGQIDLAVELFLTRDPVRGREAAQALCQMNRQRQLIECGIYEEAISMLPQGKMPDAIVLASPRWHQGVVGIVASRMAEEFCCPTFLICLDGDRGKASSRSFGGFNLFQALTRLSPMLETYGGHELAAGFTILQSHVDAFRQEICSMARAHFKESGLRTVLDVDCAISPELLTVANVEELRVLEPCGSGCPKPVFLLEGLTIEKLTPVGSGRHLRLRLQRDGHVVQGICFSSTAQSLSILEGDRVDLACTLQINEFRGSRTVQVNLLDVRPSCVCECCPDITAYLHLRNNTLAPHEAQALLPSRQTLGDIWKYLVSCGGQCTTEPMCLCRKIARQTGRSLSLSQLLTCLDIFQEARLLTVARQHQCLTVTLTNRAGKADLNRCRTMQQLQQQKGDEHGNL